MMRLLCLFVVFAGVSAVQEAQASEAPGAFLEGEQKGWFWYEKQPDKPKNEKKKQPEYSFPPKTMKEARESLKILKERAVMHPTDHNLAAYIRLQNWVTGQSELFSRVWQQTLLRHPELDYSIEHPTNAQALIVQREVNRKKHASDIRAIAKEWGLFFVFRSDCPYCHKEAPMLKRFSRRYDMSVIPVSQDGRGLPDYPNPKQDHISASLGIQAVPALFMVNPETRTVIPLAYGLISEDVLTKRLVDTMDKLKKMQGGSL